MKTITPLIAALACALLALGCGEKESVHEEAEPEETRAMMRGFFENLRVVLPTAVDGEAFRSPESRPAVAAALSALADNAAVLSEHTRRYNKGTQQLGRSLERDTTDIKRQYDRGHYDRAAFLLRLVTENCVVCHSRLPSNDDPTVAEHFIDGTSLLRLNAERRATLQIATRRFDDALVTLEGRLAVPHSHPALMLGPLTDYLTICLRVKNDYSRPIPVLTAFAQRSDLWERLRAVVEVWIAALPEVSERVQGEPNVAMARRILADGEALSQRRRDDRAGMVHSIAASGVLHRIVQSHHEPGPELSQAYYLLGETEARIGRNYWVTQAPFFLETAIRLAPKEPVARDAYAKLEEEIRLSYEGSDWDDAAGEDATLLAELRAMIEGN